MMQEEIVEMHAIVYGHVQGVGFRVVVNRYATSLGIKGTVQNLSDGSVEIVAQGSQQVLDEFIMRLKKNSGLAIIREVSLEYQPLKAKLDRFSIC